MTSILELRVPAEEFALAETLEGDPAPSIEIERATAQDHGSLVSLAWVRAEDYDRFEARLVADPTVEGFLRVGKFDEECLYRMDWTEAVDFVVHLLLEEEGTLLEARTGDREWHLQLLCPDRESLSRTYDACEANDLSMSVDSIYDLDGRPGEQFNLTEPQRKTLVTAYGSGYYDVPRSVTLSEFADTLGVSHQALSERLRRGHANLIESVLTIEPMDQTDGRTPFSNGPERTGREPQQ